MSLSKKGLVLGAILGVVLAGCGSEEKKENKKVVKTIMSMDIDS